MPAKRTYQDDSSESETESSESERVQNSGREVANQPHDEEFPINDGDMQATPPRERPLHPHDGNAKGAQFLQNNPNDEEYEAGEGPRVPTPQSKPSGVGAHPASGTLTNQPHDAYEDAPEGEEALTPPNPHRAEASRPTPASTSNNAGTLHNQPHDEVHELSDNSPMRPNPKIAAMQHKPKHAQGAMAAPEDSSDEDEATQRRKSLEYNPEDYAYLNSRVSREVQELFSHITAYQPIVHELPSKLKPFIPDFVPCVGDVDTFCKVPRPDGKPDNLGLVVVDEPSAKQSNPTVVKIGLQYVVKQTSSNLLFVDSLDDAATHPQAIDHWIAEIKQLHYKKPLPTVSYSKPMPDIEQLLQAWSPEFEEVLASDLQFPPHTIDLDIDQYVRVLCAILDIPTYANLVESLHVMFTLYLEFRQNQHFQHA